MNSLTNRPVLLVKKKKKKKQKASSIFFYRGNQQCCHLEKLGAGKVVCFHFNVWENFILRS